MEIDTLTLLAYATIWTVFYFFLSNYIAELSRKKWTTWVQSEKSRNRRNRRQNAR